MIRTYAPAGLPVEQDEAEHKHPDRRITEGCPVRRYEQIPIELFRIARVFLPIDEQTISGLNILLVGQLQHQAARLRSGKP